MLLCIFFIVIWCYNNNQTENWINYFNIFADANNVDTKQRHESMCSKPSLLKIMFPMQLNGKAGLCFYNEHNHIMNEALL